MVTTNFVNCGFVCPTKAVKEFLWWAYRTDASHFLNRTFLTARLERIAIFLLYFWKATLYKGGPKVLRLGQFFRSVFFGFWTKFGFEFFKPNQFALFPFFRRLVFDSLSRKKKFAEKNFRGRIFYSELETHVQCEGRFFIQKAFSLAKFSPTLFSKHT